MAHVRSISVRDANGDRMTLYEITGRRFFRRIRRFQLDTGEVVEADGAEFVIPSTGERLTPTGDWSSRRRGG